MIWKANQLGSKNVIVLRLCSILLPIPFSGTWQLVCVASYVHLYVSNASRLQLDLIVFAYLLSSIKMATYDTQPWSVATVQC